VAVCAGSDLMHPLGALVVGAVAGTLFVVMFTLTQNKWKIDDVLGVWPLHGLCGAWGGVAAGIFGAKALAAWAASASGHSFSEQQWAWSGPCSAELAVIGQFRVFEVVTGLLIASDSIAFSCFLGVLHGQQTLRGQSALFLPRRRPAADFQPVRLGPAPRS
jgi:ammonia channel protein AmtB